MNKLKKIHFFGESKTYCLESVIYKNVAVIPQNQSQHLFCVNDHAVKIQNEKDQYSRTKDIAQHHCNYRRITTPPTFLPF